MYTFVQLPGGYRALAKNNRYTYWKGGFDGSHEDIPEDIQRDKYIRTSRRPWCKAGVFTHHRYMWHVQTYIQRDRYIRLGKPANGCKALRYIRLSKPAN